MVSFFSLLRVLASRSFTRAELPPQLSSSPSCCGRYRAASPEKRRRATHHAGAFLFWVPELSGASARGVMLPRWAAPGTRLSPRSLLVAPTQTFG